VGRCPSLSDTILRKTFARSKGAPVAGRPRRPPQRREDDGQRLKVLNPLAGVQVPVARQRPGDDDTVHRHDAGHRRLRRRQGQFLTSTLPGDGRPRQAPDLVIGQELPQQGGLDGLDPVPVDAGRRGPRVVNFPPVAGHRDQPHAPDPAGPAGSGPGASRPCPASSGRAGRSRGVRGWPRRSGNPGPYGRGPDSVTGSGPRVRGSTCRQTGRRT
jgi:hypothetical protein